MTDRKKILDGAHEWKPFSEPGDSEFRFVPEKDAYEFRFVSRLPSPSYSGVLNLSYEEPHDQISWGHEDRPEQFMHFVRDCDHPDCVVRHVLSE